jgi:hypothetical protein
MHFDEAGGTAATCLMTQFSVNQEICAIRAVMGDKGVW